MLQSIEGRGLQRIIQLFCFVVLVTGFTGFASDAALAQVVGTATSDGDVPPTCDTDFMKSLETRAWMEGEREVVQNQNLIVKPDSVLEYTCFDRYLGVLALHDRSLFSGGAPGATIRTDMSRALEGLVGRVLLELFLKNFDYTFLGGKKSEDYCISGTILGAAYGCDRMNAIWQQAKCCNFQGDSQPQDGFFMLEDYVTGEDKRVLVKQCPKDTRWEDAFKTALAEPPWQPADWSTNKMPQYLDLLGYGDCSGVDAVPTGVTVTVADGTEFPDAVCPAPGCWYDRSVCKGGAGTPIPQPPVLPPVAPPAPPTTPLQDVCGTPRNAYANYNGCHKCPCTQQDGCKMPPSQKACPAPEDKTECLQIVDVGNETRASIGDSNDQFTIRDPGAILTIPYMSGGEGEIMRWATEGANQGEHFQHTLIISECPGVFNPSEEDCVLTGNALNNETIVGNKDYIDSCTNPAAQGRFNCFLKPHTQYYATIFQRDAWNPNTGKFDRVPPLDTCQGFGPSPKCGLVIKVTNTPTLTEEICHPK